MVFKEKTLILGGQEYVFRFFSFDDSKYTWGRGGREEREQGWSVFGDKGPETCLSLFIKQHTSVLVMFRAL